MPPHQPSAEPAPSAAPPLLGRRHKPDQATGSRGAMAPAPAPGSPVPTEQLAKAIAAILKHLASAHRKHNELFGDAEYLFLVRPALSRRRPRAAGGSHPARPSLSAGHSPGQAALWPEGQAQAHVRRRPAPLTGCCSRPARSQAACPQCPASPHLRAGQPGRVPLRQGPQGCAAQPVPEAVQPWPAAAGIPRQQPPQPRRLCRGGPQGGQAAAGPAAGRRHKEGGGPVQAARQVRGVRGQAPAVRLL